MLLTAFTLPTCTSYDEYADYSANYYDDADYNGAWYEEDCTIDGEGHSTLNGTACDLEVSGDDRAIRLPAGLTGTFTYSGCQNGRPMYTRLKQQNAPDLFLIYSSYWGDWDFCNTTELIDSNVIGYGGEGSGESRPELVMAKDWYTLKDLTIDVGDAESAWVSAPALVVRCKDATQADPSGCSDGVQNNLETGVDCGGPVCLPCVSQEQQEADYKALKEKLENEESERQNDQQMSIVGIIGIFFISLIGIAIVCGGPLIYVLKMVKSGNQPKYSAVEMLSNPRKGAHKV